MWLSAAARTLTSTSPGPSGGAGTSWTSTTSGPPCPVYTTAFNSDLRTTGSGIRDQGSENDSLESETMLRCTITISSRSLLRRCLAWTRYLSVFESGAPHTNSPWESTKLQMDSPPQKGTGSYRNFVAQRFPSQRILLKATHGILERSTCNSVISLEHLLQN